MQLRQVEDFVVGCAILPASPHDSLPLEGQGTDGGVVSLAGLSLAVVEGSRPQAVADGFVGVLVEALPQELRTPPTPMDPAAIPTAFGDGGNATVLLDRRCAGVVGAIGAEGGEQARGYDGAGAGEALEDRGVFVGGEQFGLPGFVALNGLGQDAELFDQHPYRQQGWLDDGRVGGQRGGGGDQLQSLFDDVGAAAVVGVVEAAERLAAGALQCRQVGPLGEEVERQRAVHILADQFEGLPVIAFERGDEPTGQAGAQIDGLSAGFAQGGQFAGGGGVGLPGSKLVAMFGQQVE